VVLGSSPSGPTPCSVYGNRIYSVSVFFLPTYEYFILFLDQLQKDGSIAKLEEYGKNIALDQLQNLWRKKVAVESGVETYLEIDATMLLGDKLRASIVQEVRDHNQVLHEQEKAATQMTMEGKYILKFVPMNHSVY
jgi:hypothetical protein